MTQAGIWIKHSAAITAVLYVELIGAQPDIWEHVIRRSTAADQPYIEKHVRRITPGRSQKQAILKLLATRKDVLGCLPEDPTLLEKLRYSNIDLSSEANVVLVEAGPGCARGGQGSNGAMWLIRLTGLAATLIGGPEEYFEGWLYSIEPATSKGYRDIILGWHISADEAALSYFRFDGRCYRQLSVATLRTDESGVPRVVRDTPWKSPER